MLLSNTMVYSLVCVLFYVSEASPEPRQAVEAGLLEMLGMPRRPRPILGRPVVPPAMLQLYKRQTGLDIDTVALPLPGSLARNANTARSFLHTESKVDARFRREDRFRLNFNVSSLPRSEAVTAAELRLSLPRGEGKRQIVLVHDIVRPGVRGKNGPLLRLLDTREVNPRREEGLGLDVQPAVERWASEPDQNHGLLVEVKPLEGGKTTVRLRRSAESPESQPTLLVFTDDGRQKAATLEEMLSRKKRAPQSKKQRRKDGRENCRRYPLYVDFADVGWNDWIVAPPGYEAYYCHGDCPFPLADHLNSTNHAIVQTLVNSVNPSAVPKACCVPTQLSSISMLYLDEEDKVVLKNYQEMAVVGCGCR